MNKSMNPARQVLGSGLQEETGVRVDRISPLTTPFSVTLLYQNRCLFAI